MIGVNLIKNTINKAVQTRQKLLLWSAIFGFGLLLIFVLFGLQKSSRSNNTKTANTSLKIATPGRLVDAESLWRDTLDDNQKALNTDIDALRGGYERLLQEGREREVRLQQTEQALIEAESRPVTSKENVETDNRDVTSYEGGGQDGKSKSKPGIIHIQLNLTEPKTEKMRRTVENSLPAGSFCQGVLLSGVSAPTATSGQSNPIPLLIRLTDKGNLPRRFHSDLTDCHVTASCYADLSTESLRVRLERLSCVERVTEEISETAIAGFVADSSGHEGIKGVVVSRDATYLRNSLAGSVLAGVGNVLSPQNRQSFVNPFSAGNPAISAPSTKNLLQSGMAESASSSMDRLSRYYIERAEQLQPVVVVNAGQEVTIILTQGSFIGGTLVRDEITRSREASRKAAAKETANYQEGETNS